MACKGCEIACALVHAQSQVLEEAILESPRPQRTINLEAVEEYVVPIQCMHCEDAPCILICPTEAIHRHDSNSPVLVDRERCIGCRYCMIVCPFGVIDMGRDGKAISKCDLCLERTSEGESPACVASCPTGALQFCDMNDYLKQKRILVTQALAAVHEITSKEKK
jgi:carbon-monoxide dehydrogenase iron sulfur subunit